MISVLLITYNRLDMLHRAVESFLSQDYQDKELILIDNGSTVEQDGTRVVDFYGKELQRQHASVSFYHMDYNSIHDAYHLALDFARGDTCVIMHDDDYFSGPDSLSKYAAYFDANPDIDVAYCSVFNLTEGNLIEFYPGDPDLKRLMKSDYFHFPSMAFRKDVIKDVGWIEDDIIYQIDYDWKLRCLMYARVGWIKDKTYIYVRHPGQDGNKMTREIMERENKIIFKRLGI